MFEDNFSTWNPSLWYYSFTKDNVSGWNPAWGTVSSDGSYLHMVPTVGPNGGTLLESDPFIPIPIASLPATITFKLLYPSNVYRSPGGKLLYPNGHHVSGEWLNWSFGSTGNLSCWSTHFLSGFGDKVTWTATDGTSCSITIGNNLIPADVWIEGELELFADRVESTWIEPGGDTIGLTLYGDIPSVLLMADAGPDITLSNYSELATTIIQGKVAEGLTLHLKTYDSRNYNGQSLDYVKAETAQIVETNILYRWLEGSEVLLDWTSSTNGECPLPLNGLSFSPGEHTLTLEADAEGILKSDQMVLDIDWTAIPYESSGFGPPVSEGTIKVKKNRCIPFKAELYTLGEPITSLDSPPAIQIICDPGEGGDSYEVEGLPPGEASDGNQFQFIGGYWQFNLKVKKCCTASGLYTVTMISGDPGTYVIVPQPTATFSVD